jgi:hypothetical protein
MVSVEPGNSGVSKSVSANRFAYYNNSAEGQAKFSGFTVDVMRKAAQHAKLQLTMELPAVAEDRGAAIRQLSANKTDMLGGLWAITVQNIERGADWTVPYHIGHVGALVKKSTVGQDIWGFFAPFTPAAWAFFVMMVVFYGLVNYAFEQAQNEEFPSPDEPGTRFGTVMLEWFWHTTMMALRDRDKPIKTGSGKIVSAMFSAVMLVLVAACKLSSYSIPRC